MRPRSQTGSDCFLLGVGEEVETCRGQEPCQAPGIARHCAAPSMGDGSPSPATLPQETGPLGHRELPESRQLIFFAQLCLKTGCRPQTHPAAALGLSFPICHWASVEARSQGSQACGLWNQNSRFRSWLCDLGQVASPLWASVSPSGVVPTSHSMDRAGSFNCLILSFPPPQRGDHFLSGTDPPAPWPSSSKGSATSQKKQNNKTTFGFNSCF